GPRAARAESVIPSKGCPICAARTRKSPPHRSIPAPAIEEGGAPLQHARPAAASATRAAFSREANQDPKSMVRKPITARVLGVFALTLGPALQAAVAMLDPDRPPALEEVVVEAAAEALVEQRALDVQATAADVLWRTTEQIVCSLRSAGSVSHA